jgi:predicted phosphodiesterase
VGLPLATRLGVVSDIHANLHALDAALDFLATQDLDGYVCAGDLVGYGPFPNECVRRVLDLPMTCVAGNHDLIAIGRLSDARCIPLARDSLRWTRSVLDHDVRDRLAALPLAATVQEVALHHGAPGDPQRYVVSDAEAYACLDELEGSSPGAQILVLGHTHRPMAIGRRRGSLLRGATGSVSLEPGEPMLLNPGAVGQSRTRDARARVMVLDLAQRAATFHALDYDVAGCRQALRERALSPDACHVPRSRIKQVAGAIRRRLAGSHPAARSSNESSATAGSKLLRQ